MITLNRDITIQFVSYLFFKHNYTPNSEIEVHESSIGLYNVEIGEGEVSKCYCHKYKFPDKSTSSIFLSNSYLGNV